MEPVTDPPVKRLVNLYRIVRATLDDGALDQLIEGHYRITQICLAIVVGNPTFGADLFEHILTGELKSGTELRDWCAAQLSKPDLDVRAGALVRELPFWLDEFSDWDAVREAIARVARFSFETGRVVGYQIAGAERH